MWSSLFVETFNFCHLSLKLIRKFYMTVCHTVISQFDWSVRGQCFPVLPTRYSCAYCDSLQYSGQTIRGNFPISTSVSYLPSVGLIWSIANGIFPPIILHSFNNLILTSNTNFRSDSSKISLHWVYIHIDFTKSKKS